jgi:tetratricopeptide (TPR) repeat protein
MVLALLVLTGAAYANAILHPFVYDDHHLILHNPEVQSIRNLPSIIGFHEGGFRSEARWTRSVSYALEYWAVGPYPPLFHLDNILLHAGVGLLVFLLITRVSRDPWLGWWSAALFLVHPLNTEVVAQVSGRRELLAAVLSLATLLLLLRYVRAGGRWRLITALTAFYLAAYSKEHALMTLVVFGVVDLYARRSAPTAPELSRSGAVALFRGTRDLLLDNPVLYSVLAVASLALTYTLVFSSFGGLEPGGSPGPYDVTGNSLGILEHTRLVGMGLRLLLVPVGQSADYFFDALGLTAPGWTALEVLDLGVFLAALLVTVAGLLHRSWTGFCGVWFFLFYLPHTGIIRWHEIFAERWLYMSAIGVCSTLASLLLMLSRRPRWWVTAVGIGALLLGLLMTATVLRNQVWSSSESLWKSVLDRFPSTARAHKGLANVYLRSGRMALGLAHLEKAAEILPVYRDVRLAIPTTLKDLGRFDEALASLDGMLRDWPEDPDGLYLLGQIQDALGDQTRAMETHYRVLRSDPGFARAYNDLGRLYAMRGELETAIRMFETCLEHDPTVLEALENLAEVYRLALEDDERAAVYEERARRLQRSRMGN